MPCVKGVARSDLQFPQLLTRTIVVIYEGRREGKLKE